MPPRSRSSSLSSLSSVESEDENVFNARISRNAKMQEKNQPDFEVVIDSKLSPAASGSSEEYESFQEEKEAEGKEAATENGDEMDAEGNVVDDEEIVPDHYYGGGKIPVFKPTMKQFESFKKFVDKINHYGMRSGIVKIIPPKEWLDMLPALDDKVKDIKIKNPIVQHINGNSGTFRQENVEKQRTYNLPEWRKLCEAVDHQPPAKRGERRLGQAPKQVHKAVGSKRGSRAKNIEDSEPRVPKKGKTSQLTTPVNIKDEDEDMEDLDNGSPVPKTDAHGRQPRKRATSSEAIADSHGRQPRAKRRNIRRSGKDDDYVDDYAPHDSIWDGFDYRIHDAEEYTPERCEELEKAYWRSLTYNSPLYGADMPGSLFDDSTTSWNVAKLENLLDCLGQKLPGVNTAYLYLGMWKSTFAWHLEDVDLYSINYIHFGAPKQWYSISQEDAPKFEQVMKNIWPQEARRCDQFLRHKTFLVSPSLLQQNGIRVNRLVHHQGEFVITFPYGYHSGYNLGYNCAESVNFATESWLNFGKIAKKCHCIDDAVWVDVEEIERRLRGEVTEDEYEYEEEDGEMEDLDTGTGEVLTPPESVGAKLRKKRQKVADDGSEAKKRIRRVNFKINVAAQRDHCILCPNIMPTEEMLPTDNGKKAHRLCAIYTPETYFVTDPITEKETIHNIDGIPEARLQLKCMFCRVARRGACFQCTAKKCIRGYHATCAAAAGVLVEMRDGWVEDPASGRYVKQPIIDFQCKYHRPKRDKSLDGEALEEDSAIQSFGRSLIKGDVIQMQFLRQEIFAGVVVENRLSEGMVLVDTLPKGGLMEVEWRWILATDSPGPEASLSRGNGKQPTFPKSIPEPNDPLCEGHPGFKWSEFVSEPIEKNPNQEPVKSEKNFWYYLGEQSTEAIAKYSSDPATRVHENEAVSWMSQKPVRGAKAPPRSKPVAVPPPPPPSTNGKPHQYPYYHAYQLGQPNPHLQQSPQQAQQAPQQALQQAPQQAPPPSPGQWPPYQYYYSQQASRPQQQPPHPHAPHPQHPGHPQQPHPQYHWYPPQQAHMPSHQGQQMYWYPPSQQLTSGGYPHHYPQPLQQQLQPQHQQPQQASRPVAQMGHIGATAPQLTREQQLQQIQQNQQKLSAERLRLRNSGVAPASSLPTPAQASHLAQVQPPNASASPPLSQKPSQKQPQAPVGQPMAPPVSVDTPRTMPVAPLPIDHAPAAAAGTTASPSPRIPTSAQPLTAVGSS